MGVDIVSDDECSSSSSLLKLSRTLMISKIPTTGITNEELSTFFGNFGEVTRCFTLKNNKNKKFTAGYVTFKDPKVPEKLLENSPTLTYSPDKGDDDAIIFKVKAAQDPKKNREKVAKEEEQREWDKKAAKKKKARIILRNLSFKSTEENLRNHFSKFGTLEEIKILKKKDGQMVGCAFLQFTDVQSAAKAIREANEKPFLNRPIALDWALPKQKFQQENPKETQTENNEASKNIKLENDDDDDDFSQNIKIDNDDDDDFSQNMKEENEDSEPEDDDESEGESEEEHTKKPVYETGHDVGEGRTVFIRNLNFDTDDLSLKKFFEEFGPLEFAKCVIDKATEHPRGTGFVKYKYSESVDKVLKETNLELDGRTLNVSKALAKNDADKLSKEKAAAEKKNKESKDNRNLYLAREGLVREGTIAAQGVSKSDLQLRTSIEKWKRSMLKNLNMFVSPTRLCVRNLPPSWTLDGKLRQLFKEFGKLTEAKIMRNAIGSNVSKGYGFVTFKEHESALKALRQLNNNPETWSKDQRPVIEFSIENRKALNARINRMEKSREKNPLYNKDKNKNKKSKKQEIKDSIVVKNKLQNHHQDNDDDDKEKLKFMGSKNNPKNKCLPTHVGPKIRTNKPKISRKDLLKGEKDRKNPKKRKMENFRLKQEPEAKKPKKETKKHLKNTKSLNEDKQFNTLVNNYKNKLMNTDLSLQKSKWFD